MRVVLRLLAAVLLILAAAMAVREAVAYVRVGKWQPIPLGQVWSEVNQSSLLLLEPAITRHVSQWLWDAVIFPILTVPAWGVFAALAIILLLVSLRRRSRRRY